MAAITASLASVSLVPLAKSCPILGELQRTRASPGHDDNFSPCTTRSKPALSANLRHTLDSCKDCVPGKYQPDPGRDTCSPSPTGRYNDDFGQTQSKPCSPGTYADREGQVRRRQENKLIKMGSRSSIPTTRDLSFFYRSKSKLACRPCAEFYYEENFGQASCKHSCAWLDRFCFPCSTCMPSNACQTGIYPARLFRVALPNRSAAILTTFADLVSFAQGFQDETAVMSTTHQPSWRLLYGYTLLTHNSTTAHPWILRRRRI